MRRFRILPAARLGLPLAGAALLHPASEMVLRKDGGTTDLGYPWSVQLDAKRVLVTYYFNVGSGLQHIAGTVLEIQ